MKKTAHESAHSIGHNPYSFLGLFCAWIDPDIQMRHINIVCYISVVNDLVFPVCGLL